MKVPNQKEEIFSKNNTEQRRGLRNSSIHEGTFYLVFLITNVDVILVYFLYFEFVFLFCVIDVSSFKFF